jgi:hypothetical protein
MYGVLMGNCSRRTRDLIEKDEAFNDWSMRNDHQALWQRIREIFLNDISSTESKQLRKVNQLAAFSSLRMKPDQTLQQFYNAYKLELQAARSLGNVLFMTTEFEEIEQLIPSPAYLVADSNAIVDTTGGEEDNNSTTGGRTLRSTSRNAQSSSSNVLNLPPVPQKIERRIQVPRLVEDESSLALDFLTKLDRRFEAMMLDLHNSSSKGRDEYHKDLLSAVQMAQSWKRLPDQKSKASDFVQNVQFVSLEQKTQSHQKNKNNSKDLPMREFGIVMNLE